MRAISAITATIAMVIVYVALTQALTSPEFTARYQARERTRQVQAQQQDETARRWAATWQAWGEVGFPAAAAVAVAGVGGWAVVEWQRNRTRRHEATEDYTTQRLRITTQKDIVLAYIAMYKDQEPGAKFMRLPDGTEGVFLPGENELVPIDVCRAELEQCTALARRRPPIVNVPPAPQRERRFKVVGELAEGQPHYPLPPQPPLPPGYKGLWDD